MNFKIFLVVFYSQLLLNFLVRIRYICLCSDKCIAAADRLDIIMNSEKHVHVYTERMCTKIYFASLLCTVDPTLIMYSLRGALILFCDKSLQELVNTAAVWLTVDLLTHTARISVSISFYAIFEWLRLRIMTHLIKENKCFLFTLFCFTHIYIQFLKSFKNNMFKSNHTMLRF